MAKKKKKSGWYTFRYGGIHERRLYEKGRVKAAIPIKSLGQGFTKTTKKRKKK